MKLLHTVVGHIGGVKDISFLPSIVASSRQQGRLNSIAHHHFISCGSRTSLKKWSITCPNFSTASSSAILENGIQNSDDSYNEKPDDVTCSLKSEIFNPEMNPKQLKLRTGEFIDDMRFMSCDSCYLDSDSSTDIIVCVCACSDGAVRCGIFIYFFIIILVIFVEFLLFLSQKNKAEKLKNLLLMIFRILT